MTYIPGHSAWVGYALETSTGALGGTALAITDPVDGTAASIPAAPTAITYLGYMDVPEQTTEYGAKKGFSVGSPYAQYEARGNLNPSLSFELKVGSVEFLRYCMRGSFGDYGLQPLAIYVGVAGIYTDIYRFAYVETLELNIQEGSAREITAGVTLLAIQRSFASSGAYLKNPAIADLAGAAGAPLFFHDTKSFNVVDSAGGSLNYRKFLQGIRLNLSHNLERKSARPNWGDGSPLSLTSYAIMPHNISVIGEINLHDRLPENYFTGALAARNWGDITIGISDSVGGDAQFLDLRVVRPLPKTRVNRAVDPGAQLSHNISILADDITLTLPGDE